MSKRVKRPGKGSTDSKPANPSEEHLGCAGGLTIGIRARHAETGASREMAVCTFPNEFLNGLLGDDWRLLAKSLASDNSEYLSAKMKVFAAEMAERKRRPSTAQIGLLVGLFANINLQQILEQREDGPTCQAVEIEAMEAAGGATVIPFRPRTGRASGRRFADPDSAA